MKLKSPLSLLASLAALTLLVSGCARFSTKQVDNRYYETGKLSDEISTKASTWTLFSSKSQLQNFKASQTEKTQGATVGLLTQQGGTNAVDSLKVLLDLLVTIEKLKSPTP